MIDQVYINIKSGNGGNGAISGRHEKFIPRGGPDGGDGGSGGDVIFRGNRNINTLIGFRYKKIFKAENGGNGASAKKHGKNGKSIYIDVPTGTQIVDSNEEIIFDIVEHDQEEIVIFGGQGGYGNVKYTSSTNVSATITKSKSFLLATAAAFFRQIANTCSATVPLYIASSTSSNAC